MMQESKIVMDGNIDISGLDIKKENTVMLDGKDWSEFNLAKSFSKNQMFSHTDKDDINDEDS